jgi:hypothetical protein
MTAMKQFVPRVRFDKTTHARTHTHAHAHTHTHTHTHIYIYIYIYCYMCEVSLVVALALLQQCNSTTSHFLSHATILGR